MPIMFRRAVQILGLACALVSTAASAQTFTRGAPIVIEASGRNEPAAQVPPPLSQKNEAAASVAAQPARPMAAPGICVAGSSEPTEIVTLAAALKCDPDLIFEYVYNTIEYEPLWGSDKGALGTLLDLRGNDIDQAQLLIALLKAAGYAANFQYGNIQVTGETAPGWLGVPNDAIAIGTLLASGSIPIGPIHYNNDGTLGFVDVGHVWVQVAINGTTYVFDPSFKQHTITSGWSDLAGAMGYSQSQVLADAGGTSDAVSIAGLNRPALRADLVRYASNLVAAITSQNPALTLNDVIGGKTILPLKKSPLRQTTLSYLSTNQPSGGIQTWTTVPDAYRACFTISMPGVTAQPCATATSQTILLYADQTYGQRITVSSVPDPAHTGNVIPTLLINGQAPASGTNTGPSTAVGQSWAIPVSITHPGGATANTQSDTLRVKAGGSYLIGAGWGQVGRGMVDKHRQLLAQAVAGGADPASEVVMGETLAVISYNWLAENATLQQVSDALGHATTQYHHGVGITGQTAIQGQSNTQGPYVDLPMNALSLVQGRCWPQTTCPFPGPILPVFMSGSGTSSALESAVLQQTQAPTPGMTAASTLKLVDLNAGTGAKTFFADGTTSAGQAAYKASIRPSLTSSYGSADLAAIDMAITGASPPPASPAVTQSQALIPDHGNLSVGLWKGAGYTVITKGTNAISILQKISGGLSGGFSGANITTNPIPGSTAPTLSSNTFTTIPTPSASPNIPLATKPSSWSATWSDPIDTVTGALIHDHDDLTVGAGPAPYALSFSRTYVSASNLQDRGLGKGWSHSYQWSAATNSDPYQGMGANSPIDAAGTIAALVVSQDLLATSNAQTLTLAWMVDLWLTDQLTNNVAIVTGPQSSQAFAMLPHADGATTIAYNPPLASAVTLTGTGTGSASPTSFTYREKDGTTLAFGASPAGALSSWRTPNGMALGFTYDAANNLAAVRNTLGRQLTFAYDGTHLTSVSDGTRSVAFAYAGANLVRASDPLGNTTSYSYDGASHLTQIFTPARPGSPFLTNSYDGLGRVVQQADANGQTSQFFNAGPRSEMIDPAGDRHVTYQTARGKITKDAFVLDPSFGPVFNDTPQRTGRINVATNAYDGQDRLTLATAPEDGAIASVYSNDLKHNIISKTVTPKPGSPLSPLVTRYSYDPLFSKPTSVTDPRGIVTAMSYDANTGNLLSVTRNAGAGTLNATTRFSYNGVGQVTSATDPLGVVTTTSYDGFGDPAAVVRDAGGAGHLNQTTTQAYNATGDPIALTDPRGAITTKAYDADRRLVSITLPTTAAAPGALTSSFTYDADGRLLQSQDSAAGVLLRQTATTYTPTGQVATASDANGNVTRNSYDAADRLASVTDPLGRTTSYAYDAMGRRTQVSNTAVLPTTPLAAQGYTPDGQVATLTLAQSASALNTTTYAYDGFDRLATTTYPDSASDTERLAYDPDGNVTQRITRRGDTITYGYDALNDLTTKTPPSGQPVVSYRYDLLGRQIGVSDTSATLVAAVPPAGGTVSYSQSASYDALNRPLTISWSPAPVQTAPSASTATFGFRYNATNQRIGQTSTDASFWDVPKSASTTTYAINSLDQVTSFTKKDTTTSLAYDANGNLTSDGTFTFAYDPENRLGTVTRGSSAVASDLYDGQGRRKQASVGSAKTVFVTDAANREILNYDGTTGQVGQWYAYGPGPNDVLAGMDGAGANRTTFVPDIQGSFIATLASNATALSKAGVQPYGESATTTGPFRYTGQRIDPETNGLYYYRARMYAPALGRFLQPDPIGTRGGTNLYAYVGNDPLNATDPDGLVASLVAGYAKTAAGGAARGLNSALDNCGAVCDPGVYAALQPVIPPAGLVSASLQGLRTLATLGAGLGRAAEGASSGLTTLYRAVGPAELDDIMATGTFRNLGSAEGKYFTTSGKAASSYAQQAVKSFGDQPYTLVQTHVQDSIFEGLTPAIVDRGIPAWVIPNARLTGLTPNVLNYSLVPGSP